MFWCVDCLRTNSSTQEQVKYNGKNTFLITEGVSNKKIFDGASGSGKSTILWYTNKLRLINDGYPIFFNIQNSDLGNMCVQRNPANFSQISISNNIVMITESSGHDKTYMRHSGGYPVHTKRKSDIIKITDACGHTNKPNNNVENFSDCNTPNNKAGYDNFCGWSLRLLNFDGGNPVSGFVKSTKKNKSVSLYETLPSLNIPRARSETACVKNWSMAKLNNVGSICSEQNSNLTFYLQSKRKFALYHPGSGKTTCSCLTIGLQTIGALNSYTIVMHTSIFQRELVVSLIFTERKQNMDNNLYGWHLRLLRNDGGNPASGFFRYWWSNKVPKDVIFVYEIFESLITGASSKIHVKMLNIGSKQNSDLTLCQHKKFCCHPGSKQNSDLTLCQQTKFCCHPGSKQNSDLTLCQQTKFCCHPGSKQNSDLTLCQQTKFCCHPGSKQNSDLTLCQHTKFCCHPGSKQNSDLTLCQQTKFCCHPGSKQNSDLTLCQQTKFCCHPGSKQNSDLTLCQHKKFCCHPGSKQNSDLTLCQHTIFCCHPGSKQNSDLTLCQHTIFCCHPGSKQNSDLTLCQHTIFCCHPGSKQNSDLTLCQQTKFCCHPESKQNSDLTLCQHKKFCCHPGSGKLSTKERREVNQYCTKRKIKIYDMHSNFCGWSLRLLNLTIGDNQDNISKKHRYWYQSSYGLMAEDYSDLIIFWVNVKQLPFRNGVNIITTVVLEQKSNVDKWSYWGGDTSLHSACKNGHWHTKALHLHIISSLNTHTPNYCMGEQFGIAKLMMSGMKSHYGYKLTNIEYCRAFRSAESFSSCSYN